MKLTKTILLTVALTSLISVMAHAVPINGSIGFNGSGTGVGTGSPAGSTGGTLTFNNPMTVDIRIGDYAGVPMGTTSNFLPISWTGNGAGAVLTSVNSPEWTFTSGGTTYTFNLLALSNASIGGGSVSLSGTGTASITGAINRDLTFASFSVQGTGNNFTFQIVQTSTTGSGQAVPEGGSAICLLGLGLMALVGARKKFLTA